MKCRNCKSNIPDELHFTFCGYCGERLIREKKKKDEIKVPAPRMKGKRWYLELRREGVTVIEDTEAAAIAKALAIRAGFIAAEKKAPPLTLRQAIDKYIRERDNALSPATIRGYYTIQRNAFGGVMDKDIHAVGCWQAAVNAEATRVSAKTLKNEWGLIETVLRANRVDIDVSSLPQVIRKELPWLDYSQIKQFLAAVRGEPCELGALLALHSLRRSEVLALSPDKIKGGKILVHGSAVVDKDGKLVRKKENKNTTSRREVDIVIARLADLLRASSTPAGVPYVRYNPNTLTNQINRICAREGLPLVGMHGLRRSFASLAYHLGWSERQTMQVGGWADLKTVHDIYIKLAAADQKRDIDKMREFYAL
nr:MAG TPA_asm: Integrase [Caudoviricetes sp.]